MKLGDKYPIIALIDEAISSRQSEVRNYLGASEIGEPCERKLWYGYNLGKKKPEARVQRIFDFGHMLEDYLIKLLRDAGLTIYERTNDLQQFRFYAHDNRFSGSVDGIVVGLPDSSEPHILEFKSAKDSRFKEFKKNGVKATEEKYYAQVQCYMHGFELKDTLFMVINKDDSSLYYERIKYDETYALRMLNKALTVVEAKEPLARAYSKKTDYRCSYCEFKERCWNGN